MYVFVYVYIYIYIYTHTHTHTHTHTYIHICQMEFNHESILVSRYIAPHVFNLGNRGVYIYIYTHTHKLLCVCMYGKMGARVYLISNMHNLPDLLETTPCMRKLQDPKTNDVGDQEYYVEE